MRLAGRRRQHWYELELDWLERMVDRRLKDLPGGLELLRAGESELVLLEQLDTVSPREALMRHRDGATLWLLLDAGRPAFACWTFGGRMRVPGVPGGWLNLPHGVAALDEVVLGPDYRGLGLPSRVLANIGDYYASRGVRALVVGVEEDDAPAIHFVEKAGFAHVGLMRTRRIGPYKRVQLDPSERVAPHWLASALLGFDQPPSGFKPATPDEAPRRAASPLRAGTPAQR